MVLGDQDYASFMLIALEEARVSLREGNKGFGAVLLRDGDVLAKTHDTAATDSDPTAHAEMNLVREGCRKLGRNLAGCVIVSTHEPCPMCAAAMIWARVSEVAYGASIGDSQRQGRSMISIGCREIIEKSPWGMKITEGIRKQECSVLYDEGVRKLVQAFRSAGKAGWDDLGQALLEKRKAWFEKNEDSIREELRGTDVEKAYQLLLMKLGIDGNEAPIVEESDDRIVFHSMNFCPALEACKILGLDTTEVCREHTEKATEGLIRMVNPRLSFNRNYGRLRPGSAFCEEIIALR
jgi:tRNA(Arg) A34 adenosine deaminase TadA